MSDLNIAIQPLLINEGGFADVSGDTGGETYCGISRKNWPNWKGWALIDAAKPLKHGEFVHEPLTVQALVEEFYEENFWKPNRLDEIKDQAVATKILDMCVNMGSYRGIILVQEVLVNNFRNAINIDGKVGKETLRCINSAGLSFLEQLRRRCLKFYQDLAERKPELQKFLKGWERRARE